MKKFQKTLDMETSNVEGEFVRQIPMRNQLFTYNIKIGEQRGGKSCSAGALRTEKYRYIEVPRVISYPFLSVGRLLKWFDRSKRRSKNISKAFQPQVDKKRGCATSGTPMGEQFWMNFWEQNHSSADCFEQIGPNLERTGSRLQNLTKKALMGGLFWRHLDGCSYN